MDTALASLYAKDSDARTLTSRAKAVLVFPSIVRAGVLFGAQYAEGSLRDKGKTVGYYNTVSPS